LEHQTKKKKMLGQKDQPDEDQEAELDEFGNPLAEDAL